MVLLFSHIISLAYATVCIIYGFKDTHRPERHLYVSHNPNYNLSTFKIINPVYLMAIAQGIAAIFTILIEIPGSCIRPVTETRLRVQMIKYGLVGVPMQLASLIAISDNNIIPFLGCIVIPLAVATCYAGVHVLRNRRAHLWIMFSIGSVILFSLTAIALSLFIDSTNVHNKEGHAARNALISALCVKYFLEWANTLVHVHWKIHSITTLYVHSIISDGGRFIVFWLILALQQTSAHVARNYIAVGAIGTAVIFILLCAVPTGRGVIVAGVFAPNVRNKPLHA